MQRNNAAGISLIELLVAVAIVAILLAIAFPNFEDSMRRNRLATTTNELLGSVALARSEAIRNTRGAGICASADGLVCGSDWNEGWLVWTDDTDPPPAGTVIRVVNAHPRLELAAVDTGGTTTSEIGFDYRGRPSDFGSTIFSLQPDTCPSGQELVRTLTINVSGQMVNQRGNCP